MPKSPPDQVIIHRLELQETERRILEQVAATYSFRNVSKGIFNLTSDVTTVVVLLILYEWITDKKIIDDALLAVLGVGGDIASGLAENWFNYRQSAEYSEDYRERAGSVAGGLRNLLDNIIGAMTGEVVWKLNQERE